MSNTGRPTGYLLEAGYKDRSDALREAKRLRATGRYRAQVRCNSRVGGYFRGYPWRLYTQRKIR